MATHYGSLKECRRFESEKVASTNFSPIAAVRIKKASRRRDAGEVRWDNSPFWAKARGRGSHIARSALPFVPMLGGSGHGDTATASRLLRNADDANRRSRRKHGGGTDDAGLSARRLAMLCTFLAAMIPEGAREHARSPDSRYEPPGPCHVRGVFIAEGLEHHPFLRADTKREEDSKRHEVRRSCNPVRNHERLADGVEEER